MSSIYFVMSTFKDKLFVEYPIPRKLSVWEGDGLNTFPLVDLDTLIDTVVSEVASDVLITSYYQATGMTTQMPEDTISCSSAMLSGNFPFQGNRLLKVTYDRASKRAYLRFYPAVITYQRYLRLEDLENLTGYQLQYVKCYTLIKMAEKELSFLNPVTLTVDNANLDFSTLKSFIDSERQKLEFLKDNILIYNSVN